MHFIPQGTVSDQNGYGHLRDAFHNCGRFEQHIDPLKSVNLPTKLTKGFIATSQAKSIEYGLFRRVGQDLKWSVPKPVPNQRDFILR